MVWWKMIFWYFWANLILVSNFSEYEPSLRKIVRFSGLLLFGFCLIDLCNHRLSLFCYKKSIKWNQSRFYACLLWIKCKLLAQLNFSFYELVQTWATIEKIYFGRFSGLLTFSFCFIDLCNHTLFAIKTTLNQNLRWVKSA